MMRLIHFLPGKMSEYHNRCNEQEVAFTLLGSSIKIVFRVSRGFAYRYQVDGKESGL